LNITTWLGDENWDIIQFNWGLWDLCYRHPDSKEYGHRDKINGQPEYTVHEYTANLDSIVSILRYKTNAKLIFVTTTYVPKNEPGRIESDVNKYNDAAKAVMKKHGILVNDIYEPSIALHNIYGMGSNNVHYKKEGYDKLGKLIADFLEKQIK
jgi:lysophospholipase L1-like esterase